MLSMMQAPDLNSQMQCGTMISVKVTLSCTGNSPPPMVISLSFKGVPNRVTCPQVQVFPLMRNYKYLLTKFILFSCHIKYET
ncbi:hypothetical protein GmHk_01G001622 [Glycine max]|nr:hypothetical protein GmHk_01G001622 [Glycine max]